MEIDRHIIPNNTAQVESVRAAFGLYTEICKQSDTCHDAVLFIPTKRQLQGTVIEDAIGRDVAGSLAKGRLVSVTGAGQLSVMTARTFKAAWNSEIVIAIYPNKKMLDQLDSPSDARAIIVVPWVMTDKEIDQWQSTWGPSVYGEGRRPEPSLDLSRVVEKALECLSDRINLGTGLSHPSDKAAAVDLLRILHKEREIIAPESIRAWALRVDSRYHPGVKAAGIAPERAKARDHWPPSRSLAKIRSLSRRQHPLAG